MAYSICSVKNLCNPVSQSYSRADTSKKALIVDIAVSILLMIGALTVVALTLKGHNFSLLESWNYAEKLALGVGVFAFSLTLAVIESAHYLKHRKRDEIVSPSAPSVVAEVKTETPSQQFSSFNTYQEPFVEEDKTKTPTPQQISSSIEVEKPDAPVSPVVDKDQMQKQKEEKAAKLIQRTWKKQRYHLKQKDLQGPLGEWLQKNHNNFAAHAVWPGNEVKVLEAGRLEPAESVFRTTGKVEYESSTYGNRLTYDTTSFSRETLEEIRELPGFSFSSEKFPNYPFEYDPAPCLKLQQEITEHENNEGYPILKKIRELESLAPPKLKVSYTFTDACRNLCKRTGLREHHLAVLRDQMLPLEKRVDYQLALHYKHLKSIGKSDEKASNKCREARESVIYPNKMNEDIRMSRDTIFWGYGDLVVLAGDRDKITGTCLPGEIGLKSPYQNDGKFFSLSLSDPSVFLLSPHKEEWKYPSDAKIIFIKDLTPRQARFFSVPLELDEKAHKKLVTSKSPSTAPNYRAPFKLHKPEWKLSS